jgi:hypothetical protein
MLMCKFDPILAFQYFNMGGIHLKAFFIEIFLDLKHMIKAKLRGLSPQATIPTERPPLVGEVSANLCG